MVSLFTSISVDDHRHPTNSKAISTPDCQILVSEKNSFTCSENRRHRGFTWTCDASLEVLPPPYSDLEHGS